MIGASSIRAAIERAEAVASDLSDDAEMWDDAIPDEEDAEQRAIFAESANDAVADAKAIRLLIAFARQHITLETERSADAAEGERIASKGVF